MEHYICPICKREFTSLLGLSIHYTASHGDIIKFKKYWLYERFGYSVPKCMYCDNEVKIDERNYRKHITCSNSDCVKKYHASIQHKVYETNPELREIHRKNDWIICVMNCIMKKQLGAYVLQKSTHF